MKVIHCNPIATQMHEGVIGGTELDDFKPAIIELRYYFQGLCLHPHVFPVVQQPDLMLVCKKAFNIAKVQLF